MRQVNDSVIMATACYILQEKAKQGTADSERVFDLERRLLGIMEAELKSESQFVYATRNMGTLRGCWGLLSLNGPVAFYEVLDAMSYKRGLRGIAKHKVAT
jgi:hypothetical protein